MALEHVNIPRGSSRRRPRKPLPPGKKPWVILGLCAGAALILLIVGLVRTLRAPEEKPPKPTPAPGPDRGQEPGYYPDWFTEELAHKRPGTKPETHKVEHTCMSMQIRMLAPAQPDRELEALRHDPAAFNDKLAEKYGE